MDINEILTTIITVLVIPAIPVLAGYIIQFLKNQTAKLKAETESELQHKYLTLLDDAIYSTVQSFNQTLVEGLKSKAEDGKLTKEDAQDIKKQVFNTVIDTLSPQVRLALNEMFGDAKTYIDNSIEKWVAELKQK